MRMFAAFLLSGSIAVAAAGQAEAPAGSPSNQEVSSPQASVAVQPSSRAITVPAGTKVLLQLKGPIDTKSAHVGDGVYCQTSFPVTQENIVVIPAGTYVKGEIAHVERAGRSEER